MLKHKKPTTNASPISSDKLDFKFSELNSKELQTIVETLNSEQSISTLDLWGCYISRDRLRSLLSALGKYRKLEILDLGDNYLADDGCSNVCNFAKTAMITTLILDGNSLTDTVGAMLAEVLTTNPILRTLSLRNNGLGNTSAVHLANALRKNRTLKTLNLYHNAIGGQGARALCAMLQTNRCLISLDLRCNAVPTHSLLEAIQQLCLCNQRGLDPYSSTVTDKSATGTSTTTIRTIARAGLASASLFSLKHDDTERTDVEDNVSYSYKPLLQRISDQIDATSNDDSDEGMHICI